METSPVTWRGNSAPSSRRAKAASAAVEQGQQPRLVDDRDAERLGLRELGAGFGAGDDVVGLLRHRARDLAALRLDHLLRVFARQRWQGAGEDEGLAGERLRRRAGFAFALRPFDPCLQPAIDDLEVMRLVEESVNAFSDDRAG